MGTKKLLREALGRQYRFNAVPEDGGRWTIWFPDLPGCMSYAETWDEVGPMARKSFEIWMESEVERGHPIPDPVPYEGGLFWPEGLLVAGLLPGEMTSETAAARLGIKRSRLHQLARKHNLGRRVANAKFFSEADLAILAGRKTEPGRARKAEVEAVAAD